jgi:hypothetical protein
MERAEQQPKNNACNGALGRNAGISEPIIAAVISQRASKPRRPFQLVQFSSIWGNQANCAAVLTSTVRSSIQRESDDEKQAKTLQPLSSLVHSEEAVLAVGFDREGSRHRLRPRGLMRGTVAIP